VIVDAADDGLMMIAGVGAGVDDDNGKHNRVDDCSDVGVVAVDGCVTVEVAGNDTVGAVVVVLVVGVVVSSTAGIIRNVSRYRIRDASDGNTHAMTDIRIPDTIVILSIRTTNDIDSCEDDIDDGMERGVGIAMPSVFVVPF
jgi:hypothetical protein